MDITSVIFLERCDLLIHTSVYMYLLFYIILWSQFAFPTSEGFRESATSGWEQFCINKPLFQLQNKWRWILFETVFYKSIIEHP